MVLLYGRLSLAAVVLHAVAAYSGPKTLVEHLYGMDHNQLDDGFPFEEPRVVSSDDPSFAQGYFLTEAAAGPDAAKCLDGSPALYYHRKGTGSGINKWLLYQEGGGWCYTPENCAVRATNGLGSTTRDAANMSINNSYFSMDATKNPLMYNWNVVYLRYCDGGSLSADKPSPTVVGNQTIYYRGRAILDAEIASLLQDRGMSQATDVVVSGCSAGGLATYLHCDKWATAIINATADKAKVVCMPDSGFFIDKDIIPGIGYGTMMRYIYNFQETSPAGLNQFCVAAHAATNDTEKCILAQWSSQYIKTPTFPIQSRFDAWQKKVIMRNPTDAVFNEYGNNFTAIMQSNLLNQKQHGAFLNSCLNHCNNWGGPVADGLSAGQALNEWYTKGSGGLSNGGLFYQDATYPCATCCSGPGN